MYDFVQYCLNLHTPVRRHDFTMEVWRWKWYSLERALLPTWLWPFHSLSKGRWQLSEFTEAHKYGGPKWSFGIFPVPFHFNSIFQIHSYLILNTTITIYSICIFITKFPVLTQLAEFMILNCSSTHSKQLLGDLNISLFENEIPNVALSHLPKKLN